MATAKNPTLSYNPAFILFNFPISLAITAIHAGNTPNDGKLYPKDGQMLLEGLFNMPFECDLRFRGQITTEATQTKPKYYTNGELVICPLSDCNHGITTQWSAIF